MSKENSSTSNRNEETRPQAFSRRTKPKGNLSDMATKFPVLPKCGLCSKSTNNKHSKGQLLTRTPETSPVGPVFQRSRKSLKSLSWTHAAMPEEFRHRSRSTLGEGTFLEPTISRPRHKPRLVLAGSKPTRLMTLSFALPKLLMTPTSDSATTSKHAPSCVSAAAAILSAVNTSVDQKSDLTAASNDWTHSLIRQPSMPVFQLLPSLDRDGGLKLLYQRSKLLNGVKYAYGPVSDYCEQQRQRKDVFFDFLGATQLKSVSDEEVIFGDAQIIILRHIGWETSRIQWLLDLERRRLERDKSTRVRKGKIKSRKSTKQASQGNVRN